MKASPLASGISLTCVRTFIGATDTLQLQFQPPKSPIGVHLDHQFMGAERRQDILPGNCSRHVVRRSTCTAFLVLASIEKHVREARLAVALTVIFLKTR